MDTQNYKYVLAKFYLKRFYTCIPQCEGTLQTFSFITFVKGTIYAYKTQGSKNAKSMETSK